MIYQTDPNRYFVLLPSYLLVGCYTKVNYTRVTYTGTIYTSLHRGRTEMCLRDILAVTFPAKVEE